MPWYHLPAYFFGGAFLANFVPHFVTGVLGREMPTPFASPPFRGPSSSRVNILYGVCNLTFAYGLLSRVGDFDLRRALHVGAVGLGLTAMALLIAGSMTRHRGGHS